MDRINHVLTGFYTINNAIFVIPESKAIWKMFADFVYLADAYKRKLFLG